MHIPNVMTKACLLVMLCFMTSCVKYYDLIKSEFPQGKDQPDYRVVASLYKRTATVYDEFQTKAAFNALWLSDELRTAYVNVYCNKRGLSNDEKEEMLKRQLEENKYWVSFYVLADIRSKTNSSLSDPNAMWTPYLKLGDFDTLVPESIKEVDLDPEFQLFFGKTFNLFKVAYLIKFPIQPQPSVVAAAAISDSGADTPKPACTRVVAPRPDLARKLANCSITLVQLVIRSIYKECTLTWDRDEMAKKRKVLCDEDFYWG